MLPLSFIKTTHATFRTVLRIYKLEYNIRVQLARKCSDQRHNWTQACEIVNKVLFVKNNKENKEAHVIHTNIYIYI